MWICAFAACLALLGLGAAAPAASALPSGFWGVVPQASQSSEQLQRLRLGGVESIRMPIAWPAVQPSPEAAPHWTAIDSEVGAAAAAGIRVLPFVYGAPSWAVPTDRHYKSPKNLPVRTAKQRAAWSELLKSAVRRYGPGGSFWAENPTIPERPIRTWQIWNEENFEYFVLRPNPAEYGKLIKLSYSAIRSVDRGAQILLGGMFARPDEATFKRKPPLAYFAADFLDKMYRQTPGIKSKFQGVALHPYTSTYKRLAPYIDEFREVLKKNRDNGKGLWITEMGWSSQKGGNSFAKGMQGQAKQLKGAFGLLRSRQRSWKVKSVYWFSVDDAKGVCNFCDGSGLFASGFVPKPAWYAYVHFTGGSPG